MQDSEAVFGAVTLLANTFAAMPMTIRKGWEEAKEHPLHRVLTSVRRLAIRLIHGCRGWKSAGTQPAMHIPTFRGMAAAQ